MPPAPLADNAVTSTGNQAAPGDRAPAPVTPGHTPRKARPLLPRRAQAALPTAACSDNAGSASAETRGGRLRRAAAALLRPGPKIGGSYRDPLFGRPDLVEDDYYRFRHQPRGW